MNSVALGTTVNPKYGIEEDVQQHLVLDGVTWEQYETLRNTLDDFPGLKMIYLAGTLEFFMPSAKHEQSKTILGRLLELYSLEANIRLYGCGSTTYRKKAKERGIEPDESYCLDRIKEFPDLAIEVIVTSGNIDLLEVYRGLGVAEVWFWQENRLSLYRLRGENYEEITRSELLPDLDLDLLVRCANLPDQYDAAIEFRNALRH